MFVLLQKSDEISYEADLDGMSAVTASSVIHT